MKGDLAAKSGDPLIPLPLSPPLAAAGTVEPSRYFRSVERSGRGCGIDGVPRESERRERTSTRFSSNRPWRTVRHGS